MRKNKMMRTAAVLGVATMLTASVLSGTFAKYTTQSTGQDSARVAKWGLNDSSSITLTNLFESSYNNGTDGSGFETVKGEKGVDVIAPGTSGAATFAFNYKDKNGSSTVAAPEVGYTFKVSTEGSNCAESIKENTNIVWSLDGKEAPATTGANAATQGSWDALIAAIEALDGNVEQNDSKPADYYAPGTLPKAFYGESTDNDKKHIVSWKWKYQTDADGKETDDNDSTDTNMGNADDLADVKLVITITATQVD